MTEEESECEPVEEDKADIKNSLDDYISYYNPRKGFGFVYDVSDQKQYFFHISEVKNIQTIGKIELFDKVLSFDLGKSPKDGRIQAVDVVFKAREGEVIS
jgi:cold shock CspA family protein